MIATATGQFVVYLTNDPIDDAAVESVKESVPGAVVLADVLEPLYDTSIATGFIFSKERKLHRHRHHIV